MLRRIHESFQTGTLARRLLAGTLIWTLGGLLATGFVLTDLFQEHIARQFRSELLIYLNQLTANLETDASGAVRLKRELSDPRLQKPLSGLYWQIGTTDTPALLRSRSLWDSVLPLPDPQTAGRGGGELVEHDVPGPDESRLFVVARRIVPADSPQQLLWLIVAADRGAMEEPVRNFAGILAVALCILTAGLVAATLAQLRYALAPLDELRRSLAEVREGRLRHIAGQYPAEVEPLVKDFNDMLAHDAAVVERARAQAGNLAHALKTPLAILSGAATRPDRRDDPLAKLVHEQVAAASRQVDYHLSRSRAAAARAVRQRTPLVPLLAGLARVMERLHGDRDLDIEMVDIPEHAAFQGDAQDFQEMAGNLLDNACKWATHRIEIRVLAAEDTVEVRIDDDGPGLPEESRQRVLERGARADESVPGNGLGLAIVADLAQIYGGRIDLEPAELGGLSARLVLPLYRMPS